MRYLSVCSGIEAATVAWHPLGWTPAAFSEIEAFPRAVLQHHYPDIPLHGDFTTIGADDYGPIDLLVGGTPCQSFSIAGLRGGLADDRGNLALEFLRLADRTRPRWLVWENVPGVFSSLSHDAPDFSPPDIDLDAGNGPADGEEVVVEDSYDAIESHAFGCFLAGLQELGYGAAYRVLDAQYAGVPQRRRRVFVVGYLGDWRRAAAVLLERHSLQGHPAPRRKTGEGITPGAGERAISGEWPASVAPTLNAAFGDKQGLEDQHALNGAGLFIAHSLRGEGFDASEDGTGRGTPLVPVAFNLRGREDGAQPEADPDNLAALRAASGGSSRSYIAFSIMPMNSGKDYKARETDVAQPIMAGGPVGGNQGGDFIAQAVAGIVETMYGVSHADASQTHPDQALRALREAVGAKAYSKWCAGILAAFRTPEVLRSKVHGRSVRWARDDWNELGDDALSCPQDGAAWPMLALWQAGCVGRAPRGWQPSEQLARELVAHLSELPHQRTSAARFLLGLWRASEGLGLLREALSALQEAWRPAENEGQSARLTSAVRRLTPEECEKLQGFSPGYTAIPWRGKPASECPDGPRYKALGNSMAVPCMAWMGQRIQQVEALSSLAEAA